MRAAHVGLALVMIAALGASGSSTRRASAGDPPKPAGGALRCVVAGRIVDGYEEGVLDAKVTWFADTPAGDRSRGEPVRTDAAGRFRLAVDGPSDEELRGAIHATRGDDGAAIEPVRVRVGTAERDEGSISLRPARPLEVEVRREGSPVPGATAWLWSWEGNMYRGGPTFLGTATTDPNGRVAMGAIPHAYVKLFVRAPDGSVGEQTRQVVLGSAATRLRVEVARSRAVRVLVTSDADPAAPIAGAVVMRRFGFPLEDVAQSFAAHVPSRIPPTEGDGSVSVDGLRADWAVDLEARVAGHPVGRTECKAGETTATIVIPRATLIPVKEGERPPPPDGTRLVVRCRRSKETAIEGWMQHGSIAVPLTEHQVDPGLAVAPDGSIAPLKRLEPTSFFKPRSLVVRIVDKDGHAITGTKVSLASSPYLEGPQDDPIPTDAEGRARFSGLAPMKHMIYGFPTAERPHGSRIDEVDLGPGETTRDVVVGAEAIIVARVTVDGRPALPESLGWTISGGIVVDSTTDRAAGAVRIRARPEANAPATGSIEVGGEGVRRNRFAFAWPAGGETASIDVALFRSPEVVVEVRADPDADVDVFLEKWCPWNRDNPWLAAHDVYPHLRGRTTVDLDRGRYRLHDTRTGVLSAPFEVPDHGGHVLATLDLTGLVMIRGRVECPDASEAANVEIGVEGEGIDARVAFAVPFAGGHGLPYDGKSFAVRVPAGRKVTLWPWHHTIQPARDGGEVTVAGPRDDVILKMGTGATLVLTLADPGGSPLPSGALQRTLIAALPADHPSREAVVRSAKPVEGKAGTVSVSGLPFGTLDLWVVTDLFALDGYAVRRVKRSPILEDTVDVGEVRMTRGSRVTIRRVEKAGGPVSIDDVQGHAVGMFGPRQWLSLDGSATGPDVVGQFKCLGAGRWYLSVKATRRTPSGEAREEREFEVDVDGEHDQTLDVDFSEPRAAAPR